MRVGVFAKTFPGADPQPVLAACAAAGFGSAQYNMACSGLGPLPPSIPAAAADAVAAAAQATGIGIAAISATYNMTDPDPARRIAGRQAFAAIARQAKHMGARLLTVCTGSFDADDQWRAHPANATPAAWTEMCREFDLLLPLADENDILIGVEPEGANVVGSARAAARLLRTYPGGPIRIVLDLANLIEPETAGRQRAILDEALDLLGPSIALVHAKDRDQKGRAVAAGRGVIDWAYLLARLKAMGFDGDLIAHGMAAAEAPAVASYLTAAIGRT